VKPSNKRSWQELLVLRHLVSEDQFYHFCLRRSKTCIRLLCVRICENLLQVLIRVHVVISVRMFLPEFFVCGCCYQAYYLCEDVVMRLHVFLLCHMTN
jgi:hypothetical protein